jgi:hypothetical protein
MLAAVRPMAKRAEPKRQEILDDTVFFTCANAACPQYNVPLLAPRLAVERADPAVVRHVLAEEQAAERERVRQHEEARRLEELTGLTHILRVASEWTDEGRTTPNSYTPLRRTEARSR